MKTPPWVGSNSASELLLLTLHLPLPGNERSFGHAPNSNRVVHQTVSPTAELPQ